MKCTLLVLILMIFSFEIHADGRILRISRVEQVYGHIDGYVADVTSEVPATPQEMIMMEKPESLQGPSVHDRLFNDELTNEFMFQYQQKFGRTEFEENYFLVNQQGYTITPSGLTRTEEDKERKEFAEYMMRRLTEFHTENIMKTDPQFRKVYEIKQAVSNVKLEVNPQTRVDMNYSFVGNFAKMKGTSPFVNSILTINMEPTAITPTAPDEVDWRFIKPLSRTMDAEIGYLFVACNARLAVTQRLSPEVLLTVSQTIPAQLSGKYESDREALSLIALGANF